ncbi:uncharacterized protein LOC132060916 [Lycium ferocissimum]|uniref:uncharacterized protein LOC132060916 n=1 Tax=Lycium ferocissimum TaxID=112874 RepID=UPI0028167CF5|nr:uncharacterized protein LOC132060916 [Lycium ferocissimum]
MAAKKRPSTAAPANITGVNSPEKPKSGDTSADPPIAPAKVYLIFKMSLIFIIPYFYLIFYHYKIESELRKSILINAIVSLIGFFVTVTMIPVASKYVLRRNLFGYDINKKGTPQGSIKVPESLGIIVGAVFLVVAILFQYFNFTADSDVSKVASFAVFGVFESLRFVKDDLLYVLITAFVDLLFLT